MTREGEGVILLCSNVVACYYFFVFVFVSSFPGSPQHHIQIELQCRHVLFSLSHEHLPLPKLSTVGLFQNNP